jgi:cobalt/nickel transport system ATP-binding protein
VTAPLLELDGIGFGYPGRRVFERVDFRLGAGERVALVGSNGAGKSTLLRLMVGLHRPSAGRLIAFGCPRESEADFQEVRRRAGLLFQDPDDQLFCPSVLEDLAFGPLNLGKPHDEALAIAHATLATLGLEGFADRITHRLSGGEKRLVSLAAVLTMQPEVLLLDEPTNGLDEATEERLVAHLASLPQAMVLVTHDRHLVERLATRAVMMHDGTLRDAVLHRHPHTHSHLHIHVHPHAQGAPEGHEHGAVEDQD